MEPENALPYSQQLATRPNYGPDESSFHNRNLLSRGVRVEAGNIAVARLLLEVSRLLHPSPSRIVDSSRNEQPTMPATMFHNDYARIQFCSIRELSQSELQATCCVHVFRRSATKSKAVSLLLVAKRRV
jgi:hypothetical protein